MMDMYHVVTVDFMLTYKRGEVTRLRLGFQCRPFVFREWEVYMAAGQGRSNDLARDREVGDSSIWSL